LIRYAAAWAAAAPGSSRARRGADVNGREPSRRRRRRSRRSCRRCTPKPAPRQTPRTVLPHPHFSPTSPWRSVALRDPVWQLAPPRREFSSVIQQRFRFRFW
jgi:hypothetical protein